jgi:site-specific recombinase XerD
MLMPIYSAGLRPSEWMHLRKDDQHLNSHKIFFKAGIVKKDRYTILANKMRSMHQQYLYQYQPSYCLFERMYGEQYSGRSVQTVMQQAVKKSKINPFASVHTLRHSFATHLLESSTDIRYIQHILGHASVKTTEINTHITTKGNEQIKSPLDHPNL